MPDFAIKKGDVRPILTDTLTYSDGTSPNLAGGSVNFVMRSPTSVGPTTNLAATITSNTNPATVSYTFTTTDTANAGNYQAEWHVTFADTSTMTFPTDGYLDILIEEDLVTASPVGRLASLSEVHAHLNIPSNNRTQDAELLRMLDAVTPLVEFETGPIIQRTLREVYDGGGWFIELRYHPVVQVNMVAEYRGPLRYDLAQIATPDLGTIYSYYFDPTVGRVIRRTVAGGVTVFPPGPSQVFVNYTVGLPSVPPNVKFAVLEAIRENYQQTQQGNPMVGSANDVLDVLPDVSRPFFLSARVREFLQPNRRHPSVA